MNLGSWKIDDNLTFVCNTHSPTTGAATDADSAPAYRVYEDETGTAILSGTMAKLDDANTTGFYSEQITLSAANGFEKGKCYSIYISATVNSITGTMHHTLQIEAEVDANSISVTLTDSVSADGALPSLTQAVYMMLQFLTERAVSGTTVTVKKVDGTTTLMTFTINDADNPTSITRAT